MTRFIVLRTLQLIPLVFGITLVVFLMIHFAPGDAAEFAISSRAEESEIQRMREYLGLNLPWYEQYGRLLSNWARLDFGRSYVSRQPVGDMIKDRLGRTMVLIGLSILFSLLLALPIGIISAVKQYSLLDNVVTVLAFVGIATPTFWLGILFILIFSVTLHWLPTGGSGSVGKPFAIDDFVKYLIMPLLVLTLVRTASWVRYLRSSMLEVLHQDYIRTAVAKGLSQRLVLFRHALRNAVMPIVTLLGLSLPDLFAGAIITEQIFNWNGLGQLLVRSSAQRDVPVVMALIIVTGVAIGIGNMFTDIAYRFLDPRIKF